MKKSVYLSMTIVMLVSLLIGCGKSGNSGKSDASPSASSAAPVSETASNPASPSGDASATIKLASWFPKDQIAPVLDEYMRQKPNVKLEYTELVDNNDSQSGMQKLDLLVASGTDLDVALFPSASDFSKRAALDMLLPLNDMVKAEGINLADEYIVDPSTDGKVFALPDTYENFFVILNKEMLDKAKLPVPTKWTWDDFFEYGRKLTTGTGANKVYGTYFHTWAAYFELGLMNQLKDNNLLNNGVLKVDSPEIRKSLQIREQMEVKDKTAIPYSETISQKLAYRSVYFSKKAAMIVTGNWMVNEVGGSEEFPATFVTAFAPMPANASGDPVGVSPANGNFIGLLKNSKNPQAAYDFIRWYTTKGEEFANVFSAWKKQNVDAYIAGVKKKVKSPDMIDGDSLAYVIKNSPTAPLNMPPSYQVELEDAYVKEGEKFILGQQNMETTIQNANTALQKIVDANK